MLRPSTLLAVLATLLCGCAEAPTGRDLDQGERAAPDGLKIATWNMEWLNRSNDTGVVKRGNADYAKLADYADLLDADIVAVQEVDGPEALQRVFDPAIYAFHMSSRNHVQRTGYAYRKTLDVTPMPDYTALDVGSLRYGADLMVTVGGQTMRLLDVHLKSGCFTGSLTGTSSSCQKLAQQVPPLEAWIDARAAEGTPFVVLGDFNRRMFSNNNDQLWAAIDDGSPAGAELSSPTETGSALCNGGKYPAFIDHLVTGSLATELVVPGSFSQLVLTPADLSSYELTDHCPLSFELELGDGGGDPGGGGGSCTGHCGGQSPDGCWCDDQCQNYGDCCSDLATACGAPEPEPEPDPNSCAGHCGAQAPGGCWCDGQCQNYGDCCSDEAAACS